MKPLSPRAAQALRDLTELWNRALREPIPKDMEELLAKMK